MKYHPAGNVTSDRGGSVADAIAAGGRGAADGIPAAGRGIEMRRILPT